MQLNDTLLKTAGNKKIIIDKNADLISQTEDGTRTKIQVGDTFDSITVNDNIQVGGDIWMGCNSLSGLLANSSSFAGYTAGTLPDTNVIPIEDHKAYYLQARYINGKAYDFSFEDITEDNSPKGLNQILLFIDLYLAGTGSTFTFENVMWPDSNNNYDSSNAAPTITISKCNVLQFTFISDTCWLGRKLFTMPNGRLFS